MPRSKQKWLLKDITELAEEHVQPILDLLQERKIEEANEAFKRLCESIKDLKNHEAFHLAIKIVRDCGVPLEEIQTYRSPKRERP